MKILFFCENTMFSGGRYYTLFVACALASLGNEVKFVTNQTPIFAPDFKDVPGFSKIEWLIEHNCLFMEHGYDLVITAPKRAGIQGYKYSQQRNVPLYPLMFETPNFISKYRHGEDSYEEYWKGYKEILIHAKKVITISTESKKHIVEWVKCDANKVNIISPCVNSIEADKIGVLEKTNSIVSISRFLDFKRVEDLLVVAEKLERKFKIIYITGDKDTYGLYSRIMTLAQSKKLDVKVYEKISDKQKFEILKQAKVLVHPSSFEGFGLPPSEALYVGTPAIVYDLPVYKDFYGANITYVEMGNIEALYHNIVQLNYNVEQPVSKEFKQKLTYERLVKDVSKVFFGKQPALLPTKKEITLEEF